MRDLHSKLISLFLFLVSTFSVRAQAIVSSTLIDACEDTTAWKTFHSAGVIVSQRSDSGILGGSIRFDIAFTKGSGYGGVIRNCELAAPEDYEISFLMRARVPVNNFEFKVSNDSAGEDIWWVNKRNFQYSTAWKRITVKKRHLAFAWGPHPSPKPDWIRRIEIVVTAGTGGKGSVWIDDLRLVALPPAPKIPPQPVVAASSQQGSRTSALNIISGERGGWVSKSRADEWLKIDYGYRKEFGALKLIWDKALSNMNYDVLGSTDGIVFDTLHTVKKGEGGSVLLYAPESEARIVKLMLHSNQSRRAFHLLGIELVPSDSISSVNDYFAAVAKNSPKGWYPRYFLKEASYWTVVGVASDEKEALFNEDGIFETDKLHFSVEPFVRLDTGELLTWANAQESQSLADDYLPVPTVTRSYRDLDLSVTLIAYGEPGHSALSARYVLRNKSGTKQAGSFILALRPFQVNPSYQWLNNEGGFARTDSITIIGNYVIVGDKIMSVSGTPDQSGVSDIDKGDIIGHLAGGGLPSTSTIVDPLGMASAAFRYSFSLQAGDSLVVVASIPFWPGAAAQLATRQSVEEFDREFAQVRADWMRRLNTVRFELPGDARKLLDIMRSNLAYVLINKDGPGFQPGSRSYERSWIRDGSMTSAALLKFGLDRDVHDFIQWYSGYQYENGMVPCVVDRRGPDPVPENDSHGEYIFACMEYFRFTKDTVFLRQQWNHIIAAVKYMEYLRSLRMTNEFRSDSGTKRLFFGLVPESISHEGYSAKPMHSYWDNFFVLKGFKDAAAVAEILGERSQARACDSIARSFREDFYNSIALTMQTHKIEYIPGCAELGDFDPTSTSISLFPCGEFTFLPQKPLLDTYDKYYDWFEQRKNGRIDWDAFTPYEIRTVGTYVYLGQKQRANEMMDWFLPYQRPPAWNDWAEVVWHDKRTAKFIGDMPHTWVGSDFINAFRAMFVYEIDDEPSLVIGAGLKDEWVHQGLSVEGMPTHFGSLTYSIKPVDSSSVVVQIDGLINATKAPILVPVGLLSTPLWKASIGGKTVLPEKGFVRVTSLPATVLFQY